MSDSYIFTPLASLDAILRPVSAVFVIAFSGERVLAIQNERGWDIPGGYVEAGESLLEALHREVKEEAGALVQAPQPFCTLARPASHEVMLFFISDGFVLGEFLPEGDALARASITPDELVQRYHGDRMLLGRLLSLAMSELAVRRSWTSV
jgi:8-oxo-dGTP pyrophosphatase MutT (NUDIX family)